MRLFIAIDIDQANRKAISKLKKQLIAETQVTRKDLKWVESNNVHLTLKFLGEVEDTKSTEICNVVNNVSGRHKGFELEMEKVGCFGGKFARVLWVGTGKGKKKLLKLHEDLEGELALAGWARDARKFSGHLTIGRIKNSTAGVKLANVVEKYNDFKLGTVSVDSVSVYQSQLTPKGPIYTLLGNYKLR